MTDSKTPSTGDDDLVVKASAFIRDNHPRLSRQSFAKNLLLIGKYVKDKDFKDKPNEFVKKLREARGYTEELRTDSDPALAFMESLAQQHNKVNFVDQNSLMTESKSSSLSESIASDLKTLSLQDSDFVNFDRAELNEKTNENENDIARNLFLFAVKNKGSFLNAPGGSASERERAVIVFVCKILDSGIKLDRRIRIVRDTIADTHETTLLMMVAEPLWTKHKIVRTQKDNGADCQSDSGGSCVMCIETKQIGKGLTAPSTGGELKDGDIYIILDLYDEAWFKEVFVPMLSMCDGVSVAMLTKST